MEILVKPVDIELHVCDDEGGPGCDMMCYIVA